MKLEFLKDINNSGQIKEVLVNKLVRLYDFDHIQANNFRTIIQKSIVQNGKQIKINDIEFIEAINCTLFFRVSDIDLGIQCDDNSIFFCDLTRNGFENMINLIKPFCKKECNGYQWLYDIDTPIEFLFSPNGNW